MIDPKLNAFYARDEQGAVITDPEGRPQFVARPLGLRTPDDLDRVLALFKPPAVLEEFARQAQSYCAWAFFDAYHAWLEATPPPPERARDESGQYLEDDPDTAGSEAWVGGYTPELHEADLAAHAAAEPVAPVEQTLQAFIESRPSFARWSKMWGVEFDGVRCSAHREDMWGLDSVEPWIREGHQTHFDFHNGQQLLLTPENIDAFRAVWVPFRAAFFDRD